MRLTVTCPACQSQYQVDPNLRGKRMRCPNTICRKVFEIPGGEAEAPAPPPVVVSPVTPKPANVTRPPAPSWSAPPPVRATNRATISPSSPVDFEPPTDFPGDEPAAAPSTPPSSEAEPPPAKKTKRSPLIVVGVLLFALVGIGGVVAERYFAREQSLETDMIARAEKEYRAGDFHQAMTLYQKLQRDYPANRERFAFLATLSELRAEVDAAREAPELGEAREHFLGFLDAHQDNPLFKGREPEAFDSLLPLVKRSTQLLEETPDASALASTEATWNRARPLASGSTANDDEAFGKSFRVIRKTLADRDRHRSTLAAIEGRLQNPTAAAIAEAKALSSAAKLHDDPAIVAALTALRSALKASIIFEPTVAAATPTPTDPFPLIAFAPAVRVPQPARGHESIVALAPAGVLYALKPRLGDLAWAERLGIDSRIAPLRLVEDDQTRFVIVANDGKTLALVDSATGKALWRTPLVAAVAAQPIVAKERLLVPLVTGRLDLIDLDSGKHLGFFPFDQPLANGGAVHPGTALVSVPGEANCVYVLDLDRQACVAILETGHAAGALLGPPIIVAEDATRAAIVLTQAEAGPRIRLRPLSYPLDKPGRPAPKDLIFPGTLSGAPYHDAESILLVTEEGQLHRVGLRLPGNPNDPLLFPLTPTPIAVEAAPRGQTMRARIVHVDAENIWLISAGRLQRLQKSLSPQTGPNLKARWPTALPLGEPLHAAQSFTDADGTVLFVATHDSGSSAALLTAIDGETGKIFWQTQLGSIPRGNVLADRQPDATRILWDDGVGLNRIAVDATGSLKSKDDSFPYPERQDRSSLQPVFTGLVRFGWSPRSKSASVVDADFGPRAKPRFEVVKLPETPAGAPIAMEGGFLVPLASGVVVNWRAGGVIVTGPDWRDPKAPRESEAAIVVIGPKRFVVTDGRGGLAAYSWDDTWRELGRYRSAERPLQGQPFAAWVKEEPRILSADAQNELVMFDAKLKRLPGKSWPLGGKITAGPFLAGERVLLVVDGKRLVSIDLTAGALWNVALLAEILVAPTLVDDNLIVADEHANFWSLDPATGSNRIADDRPALSIRANIVPAANPIALPDGKLFVLWSDGTAGVVAIPLKQPQSP